MLEAHVMRCTVTTDYIKTLKREIEGELLRSQLLSSFPNLMYIEMKLRLFLPVLLKQPTQSLNLCPSIIFWEEMIKKNLLSACLLLI